MYKLRSTFFLHYNMYQARGPGNFTRGDFSSFSSPIYGKKFNLVGFLRKSPENLPPPLNFSHTKIPKSPTPKISGYTPDLYRRHYEKGKIIKFLINFIQRCLEDFISDCSK